MAIEHINEFDTLNAGREKINKALDDAVTVLKEATGKDVISAPEIILARGGEADLKTRLDKEHQEVTAQLADATTEINKKRNILTKLELEDISPYFLSAIDGSGGPFNLLSKPQEKSVGMLETEYLMAEGIPSKNIFTGWERGALSWSTGAKVDGTTTIRSKAPMRVYPGEYIWITDPEAISTLASNVQILFEFDETMTFIRTVSLNVGPGAGRGFSPSANGRFVMFLSQTNGSGGYTIPDYNNLKTQVEHNTSFSGYETPYPKTKLPVYPSRKNVDKTGNYAYKKINEAVEKAGDSPSNPVTIKINPGIYTESIFVGGQRHLSFIGLNKKDCVIKTTTGLYADAPMEIAGDVLVENITFIAEYPGAESELTGQKSYAIHVDYAGEGITEFNNCKFNSNVTSALGLGTQNNQTIIFRDCEFESTSLLNVYGAAFLHASNVTTDTGQRVEFHNCTFNSPTETVVWLSDVNGTSEIEIGFYNCKLWSTISGKADSVVAIYGSKVKIAPDSYGNNVAILNK